MSEKDHAEFAPAGAIVQSIFAGGVYVGKKYFFDKLNGGGETPPFPFLAAEGFSPSRSFQRRKNAVYFFCIS